MMRIPLSFLTLLAIAILAVGIAGCGSDSSSSSDSKSKASAAKDGEASTEMKTAPANATKVNLSIGEMYIKPSVATAKGPVTFTVVNEGKMMHEVVILKTDTPAAELTVKDGRVSEDDSVGELADIAAGDTATASFDLKPGKYVLVCNIAGHYQGGMRAAFTVTA